jgi:5-formyltetrahydrofolate cyclo-ligase
VTLPHDDAPTSTDAPPVAAAVAATKAALREQLREVRRARVPDEREATAYGLVVQVLAIPEVGRLRGLATGCAAAYASFGTEPGTGPLRAALAEAGIAVLLPVIRDDGGLDWAWDHDDLAAGAVRPGIPEPTGDVVAHGLDGLVALGARVLLVPALAVDRAGHRIGKAGGFYDRLLADRRGLDPSSRPHVVAVVHDDEMLDVIPTEPHDERVDAVVTPQRYVVLA